MGALQTRLVSEDLRPSSAVSWGPRGCGGCGDVLRLGCFPVPRGWSEGISMNRRCVAGRLLWVRNTEKSPRRAPHPLSGQGRDPLCLLLAQRTPAHRTIVPPVALRSQPPR